MVSRQVIPVGAYAANCIVIWQDNACFVVDPGQDAADILAFMKERKLSSKAILLTHVHFDHIGGIPGILEAFPDLPIYAHPSDSVMFGHPMNQCPPEYPGVPKPANLLDIREAPKAFPDFALNVLETPGHTPGSVCLKFGSLLLSGDTLFAGSCGRTDFPGGSGRKIVKSIKTKLLTLPDETVVYPGHDENTSVALEKKLNPFLN